MSRRPQSVDAPSIRWHARDVADLSIARSVLHEIRPDLIFHLSGMATASPEMKLVIPALHSLLVSTVNVLVAAQEIGNPRIILAASLTEPRESAPSAVPSSPYAAAKWACSRYAAMFRELYHADVLAVRPFQTYGPGQDPNKLIPYVTRAFLAGEAPRLSSCKWAADWVYVNDVTEGFLAAAQADPVEGGTFDLGSGVLVSSREVVERIAEIVGVDMPPLFGALPDRPFEQVRAADLETTRAGLGWTPATTLEQGLAQTVSWFKGQMVAHAS